MLRSEYRLRGDALRALGTAVRYHRRTLDDIDRKIIAHVTEYGRVTNRTVQNLFDIDVYKARDILADLKQRQILVRTSQQERGPTVEYGAGSKFLALSSRRTASNEGRSTHSKRKGPREAPNER